MFLLFSCEYAMCNKGRSWSRSMGLLDAGRLPVLTGVQKNLFLLGVVHGALLHSGHASWCRSQLGSSADWNSALLCVLAFVCV